MKNPFCGINDDNIYTYWDAGDIRIGAPPIVGASEPGGRLDSLLVHDGGGTGTTTGPPIKQPARQCFPADTLVWIDGELIQISRVVPGQIVKKSLSNPKAVSLQKSVYSHEIESVIEHDESEGLWERYEIVLENGNCIVVADIHFFLLDSGLWVPVQELTSSSKLVSLEGPVGVDRVVKRSFPCIGKVYNLKVLNSERYLVGKDGIVVRDF
jgi:hypothetical protein